MPRGDCGTCCRLVVLVVVVELPAFALAPLLLDPVPVPLLGVVDAGGGIGLTGDCTSLPSEPVDSIIASGGVPWGTVAPDDVTESITAVAGNGSGLSLRVLECFGFDRPVVVPEEA